MRKTLITLLILLSSLFTVAQSEDMRGGQLMTGYYGDFYDQPYTRNFHVFYVGGGFKSPNTSIFGKVNYGYLNSNSTGYQFELDYYQRFTEKITSWWNYAYSQNENFPSHRAMMRLWYALPKAFLVSGGMNYFYFDNSLFTANVGLEKYLGNFWIEGLVNLHFKDPDPRLSYRLTSRLFWKDYNYVQLSLSTGAAQDEPWVTGTLPSPLNAHQVGLGVCTYLGNQKKFQLRASAGYSYEEYYDDMWRNRYSGAIGFVYTLKGRK